MFPLEQAYNKQVSPFDEDEMLIELPVYFDL